MTIYPLAPIYCRYCSYKLLKKPFETLSRHKQENSEGRSAGNILSTYLQCIQLICKREKVEKKQSYTYLQSLIHSSNEGVTHYGYSLKVILKRQAISNFDSQVVWDMWQCQKSWKKLILSRHPKKTEMQQIIEQASPNHKILRSADQLL